MKHLDLSYILDNVSNDEKFIHQLLDVFEKSLDKDIPELRAAITNADFDRIRRTAHKIKSGFRSLGMQMATDYLQALEDLGKNQRPISDIQAKFEGFLELIPEVKEEIKEYQQSSNPR